MYSQYGARGVYGRSSLRDNRDSELEDSAAEHSGILHDYNHHNSRPHHDHRDRDHHGQHNHGRGGASYRRRISTHYISPHAGDDGAEDYESRGRPRRDRSAEPGAGFSAFLDDMSEIGDPQPTSRSGWDYSRSNTTPLAKFSSLLAPRNGTPESAGASTSAPATKGTGNSNGSANTVAAPSAPADPKVKHPGVLSAATGGSAAALAAAAPPAATQAPATTAVATPTTEPATSTVVAQPNAGVAQPQTRDAPTTQTNPAPAQGTVSTAQTATPAAQTVTEDTTATQAAAPDTTEAPMNTSQPAPQTAANGPALSSRSGWERFRSDPRLRAALDQKIHQKYGRHPGDAPGYGHSYGPYRQYNPHHHYDPYRQYGPYGGQFDLSMFYPPPAAFPREYIQDPMAVLQAPRQFGSNLYPFGRPLFANAPEFPSLLDRAGAPYPVLPVPPVEYLRDILEKKASPGATKPQPRPAPATTSFDTECKPLLEKKETVKFLEALKKQELDPQYSDEVFRKISDIIQVRFGEREDDKIVNRVHVVPRGHFALGTVVADHPKLDVDLILPSDFVLRRWVVSNANEALRPKTVADALGLDPVSIARSEMDVEKLKWVLHAVWEQFDGVADGFVFPGGAAESGEYLPSKWCTRHKEHCGNRLRLMTSPDANPIYINIFVKVSINLNGQEMIVGADLSSAKSAGKYQMIKVLRNPGAPLGETPLSPINRSAILALIWWQRSLKASAKAGAFKIRTNHFFLALAALHALPPKDELHKDSLHVPRSDNTPLPFSLVRVMDVMLKILKYLERAYNPPPTTSDARDANGEPIRAESDQAPGPAVQYVFPLSACTTMDALYTQAASTSAAQNSLKESIALSDLKTEIDKYITSLSSRGVNADTYTDES